MQKRPIEIKCRLSHREAELLNRRVKKSGLPREVYLRELINDLLPTDAPPPDYFSMMEELREINERLSRLNVEEFDEITARLNAAILEITNAVMLPRKLK